MKDGRKRKEKGGKGSNKLVKMFRLRHIFIIYKGEEKSIKIFKGWGRSLVLFKFNSSNKALS